MHRYEIILYWSNEDQAFIAETPELPGCMAHGDDQEEALQNIKDAMPVLDRHSRRTGTTGPGTKGRALDVCLTEFDCPSATSFELGHIFWG